MNVFFPPWNPKDTGCMPVDVVLGTVCECLCILCIFSRNMVSYKPTPQPVYSVDIVANSGSYKISVHKSYIYDDIVLCVYLRMYICIHTWICEYTLVCRNEICFLLELRTYVHTYKYIRTCVYVKQCV